MLGNFWVTAQLASSQEVLSSMELEGEICNYKCESDMLSEAITYRHTNSYIPDTPVNSACFCLLCPSESAEKLLIVFGHKSWIDYTGIWRLGNNSSSRTYSSYEREPRFLTLYLAWMYGHVLLSCDFRWLQVPCDGMIPGTRSRTKCLQNYLFVYLGFLSTPSVFRLYGGEWRTSSEWG
jgi:hypothetical protein